MKTKLLYVLVSGPDDVYLEQAFVSASTAARHNPDTEIVLLTDQVTADGWLQENPLSALFRSLFSQIVVAPLDASFSAQKRSRLLKTGLREYVQGDLLYIDVDTLVARPLGSIDNFPAELAAAPDLHCRFVDHPHRQATLNICKKLGYDVSQAEYYFNGGVILVRDTPGNHRFFREWQENYLSGNAQGIYSDQPSLAKTNASGRIARLPDEWNCEVQNGVRFLKDAFIVHYMVTNISGGRLDRLYLLNDEQVLLRMREAGHITRKWRR